jgi:DNA mismatch endonuclease (patch repair protein)
VPDVYSAATRAYVMSRIRGRNTKAEVLLRRHLWARGIRGYRDHAALPGRPDIGWPRTRIAIFVDGCF